MNRIWKYMLILGAIGFVAGMAIGAIILYYSYPGVYAGGLTKGILQHVLLSGLYGTVPMGGAVVYGIEEWGILRMTLTHLVITVGAYHVFGFALGWFAFGEPEYFIMIGIMLGAYFMIWLIMYLIGRHRVRKVNRELEKWKSSKKD